MIGVTRGGLGFEDEFKIFLAFLEDIWEYERKKRGQLLKVVLQRSSGKVKLEFRWYSDKLRISQGPDVLEIVAFIVYTNL